MEAAAISHSFTPIQGASTPANRWIEIKLHERGFESISDLSAEERSLLCKEIKETARSEKSGATLTAVVASLVLLISLPVIIVLGILMSSGILVIAPDSYFYPLVGLIVGGGGVAGVKVGQGIIKYFQEKVADRITLANDLEKASTLI